jgi:beta-phosphoglucomutase
MGKLTRDPHIEAVIFDLDGVITNTVYFHYLSWQRLADEEGIPFDKMTHDRAMLGLNREDALCYLLRDRQVSLERQQLLLKRKNNYYLESIDKLNSDNLLPGIGNLLVELRTANIKIALGSSSKNAKLVLQRLGIIDLFNFIADGHSANCLIVEDAPAGVVAGLMAGMWVLGVGPSDRLAQAHLVLPTLADISWLDILAKIN